MRESTPKKADRWAFSEVYNKRFGITNTKFDISFCVFQESFLNDHYRFREFVDNVADLGHVSMIDLGRNHGLVLYYLLDHIGQRNDVSKLDYIGIDPAPLKFVYYPSSDLEFPVGYRIIDRALVFDQEKTVHLKYGENNFRNFNVKGSSKEQSKLKNQDRYEYVELEVDTLQYESFLYLVDSQSDVDTLIVKVDAKNRSSATFEELLARLANRKGNTIVACERDDTSQVNLERYKTGRRGTLAWSPTFETD